MGTWTNSDGLRVDFALTRVEKAQVGKVSTRGDVQEVRAILEVAQMSLTGGVIGGRAAVAIPLGSQIIRATLYVTETFSGASGTLDLGLANADGTYTNLDEDGIDAAIAVAVLLQGTILACDGALVGAGDDKDTLAISYPSYDIDTTDFTAGKAVLVIEYVPPLYPDQGA